MGYVCSHCKSDWTAGVKKQLAEEGAVLVASDWVHWTCPHCKAENRDLYIPDARPSSSQHLRPTGRVRWRALTAEDEARQRSILEALWVSDCMTLGAWLPVERVALDAAVELGEAELRALL